MRTFILIFIHLFIVLSGLRSQIVTGKVVNTDGVPLEMASIRVKHKTIGTTTNWEGLFELKNLLPNDTLVISHLGYTCSETSVLSPAPLIIRLNASPVTLNEVLISNLSAAQIVQRAIDRLSQNHYHKQHHLKGFFREIYLENDSIKKISEALVQLEFPHTPAKDGSIRIEKKRTIARELSQTAIKNGPLCLLEMNEVFSQKSILVERNFRKHSFYLEGVQSDGLQTWYIIRFSPVKPNSSGGYAGVLWIDSNDFGFHHLSIRKGTTTVKMVYHRLNGLYYLQTFGLVKSKETVNHSSGFIRSAKVDYVTTEILSHRIKKGTSFHQGDLLENYVDSYEPDYWGDNIQLLPDSSVVSQLTQLKTVKAADANTKTQSSMYQPNISISASSDFFHNLDLMGDDLNNINRLTYFGISKTVRLQGFMSALQVAYANWMSLPFQGVEAERRVLRKNGYTATYHPFIFNGFYNSYSHGMRDADLTGFKQASPADFLRLHTVRLESNYCSAKKIEEELFQHPFLKDDQLKNDFLRIYFIDFFTRRLFLVAPFLISSVDFEVPLKAEHKMPFATNRLKSFTHYLHQPDAGFSRIIQTDDLTSSELAYLARMRWFSALNFVPAITNLLSPIAIGKTIDLRISGAYLPVPFGEQFEQLFYLKNQHSLTVISIKEYLARNKTGFGVGVKLINHPISQNILVTTRIDYWKQPKSLSFYAHRLDEGFSVQQRYTWQKKYFQLWGGFTFKTAGYIDYATSLESDFTTQIGCRIVLKQ